VIAPPTPIDIAAWATFPTEEQNNGVSMTTFPPGVQRDSISLSLATRDLFELSLLHLLAVSKTHPQEGQINKQHSPKSFPKTTRFIEQGWTL
jgi:hypothetical protein